MKPRSAIETDRFADEHRRKKINTLGDPLTGIESQIDFAAWAAQVDRAAPPPVSPQRRNKRIARTHARLEHGFGAIEQMGGKLLRTIGQARANFAMTMMTARYSLKRLVYFQNAGFEAT